MKAPDGSRIGWGLTYEQVTPEPYDDADVEYNDGSFYDSETTRYDPTVIGGCRFCGTFLYWK
jgi:hypothetical protein